MSNDDTPKRGDDDGDARQTRALLQAMARAMSERPRGDAESPPIDLAALESPSPLIH
jgi:hypothetical protein